MSGSPDAFFVINSDVCGDLPIEEMVYDLNSKPQADGLLLTTEATREQSVNYGSVVIDKDGRVRLFFVLHRV